MSEPANKPENVLDCGGKHSATPLSHGPGSLGKVSSSLRSAGAVQGNNLGVPAHNFLNF
jgi:hypothetical protein